MMRLVNNDEPMMREDNTPSIVTRIDPHDPRWVFAMRARLSIEYQILDDDKIERLIKQAGGIGLNPIQARAIIGIVEDATQRGGIDRMAHQQISSVPFDASSEQEGLSDRARWLTFGVLFAWALMIAGVMQVVA